jgi:alpha-galactosidase
MPHPRSALAALALALPACGAAEAVTPLCTPGPAGDGTFTLALGDTCLRGVRLQVRSGGALRASTGDDTLGLDDGGAGALRIVAAAAPPVEAFVITVPGVAGEAILQQGYQSWGFSGAVRLPDAVPQNPDGAPQLGAARGDTLLETAGVSYGSAVIGAPGGPFLIAGGLSAEHATTGVTATRPAAGGAAEVTLVYGATREPLPIGADGRVASEPLYLATAADAEAGLDGLAAAMKAAQPATAVAPRRPPGGWYSWNELFTKVSADEVLAHVDVVASQLAPLGLPLVEIDDGWEQAWGDWTANDRFPGGMTVTGQAITAEGLVAGVWMAPFLVDVASHTGMTSDPALFLQDPGGGPFVHAPPGQARQFYVLDGTSAASMAIATDAIAALRAAGFRFFKLDFLYAGALPGGHSQPGATGNEALRSGLSRIREAMGPDAVLNACGAPVATVLGLADSLRVGADTAYEGVTLSWPLLTFAARNLSARAHLAPLVWPDADQAQVRAPYTDAEARAAATLAALAGPAYALGDDLTKLDPARLSLALDATVLDLAGGGPGRPVDPFEHPAADVLRIALLDDPDGAGLAPPPSAWTATGKSGKKYAVTFAWGAPRGVSITPAK